MSRITNVLQDTGVDVMEKGSGIFIACPSCQSEETSHSKYKLRVYDDTENGGFNCIKCGAKGNYAKLHYLISNGIEMPESAYKEYSKNLLQEFGEWKDRPVRKKQKIAVSADHTANIFARNAFYTQMTKTLFLYPPHRERLRFRGFTDEQIDKAGYISAPKFYSTRTNEILFGRNTDLSGIPGVFRTKSGEWTARTDYPDGVLIPIRDIKGRIEGFQIRVDHPKGSNKYLYYSSGSCESGTKAKTWIHCTEGIAESDDIILTEGALKADTIYALSGMPVIAVMGVRSVKYLPGFIEKNLTGKTIHVAFDMDSYDNPHVQKAEQALFDIFEQKEIKYRRLVWDDNYKGLDDYLNRLK